MITFIIECGITNFLCTMCVYSKFGHHPHPIGYLCAKFCSLATSIAELAHREKSLTQSINHPAYLMPREPKRLRFGKADEKLSIKLLRNTKHLHACLTELLTHTLLSSAHSPFNSFRRSIYNEQDIYMTPYYNCFFAVTQNSAILLSISQELSRNINPVYTVSIHSKPSWHVLRQTSDGRSIKWWSQ